MRDVVDLSDQAPMAGLDACARRAPGDPGHEPDIMPRAGSEPADAGMADLIDRTLASGFRWLRFPAPLEQRYTRDQAPQRLRTVLIAGLLVTVAFNLCLISDRAMIPDMFDQAMALRLWFYTPACLIGIWVLSQIPSTMVREALVVMTGLLAVVIHVYLVGMSRSPLAAAYLTALPMILLFVNVLVRPPFWMALGFSLLVQGVYLASFWLMEGRHWALFLPIELLILSSGHFTLYYLYSLEHEERHNHLLGLRQQLLQARLIEANAQLERLSRFDALTQLANRRHFDDFINQMWRASQGDDAPVACIMVDVDHFKAFNDHFGHPAGDACLVEVASALQQCLRRPGDLVARYGGEEFIAVLNRTTLPQAEEVAERVREAVQSLARSHPQAGQVGVVTVSVGVACLSRKSTHASPQGLIECADQALYQAKHHGRNRVWVQEAA